MNIQEKFKIFCEGGEKTIQEMMNGLAAKQNELKEKEDALNSYNARLQEMANDLVKGKGELTAQEEKLAGDKANLEAVKQQIRDQQESFSAASQLLEKEKESLASGLSDLQNKTNALTEREHGVEIREAEVIVREKKVEEKIKLHNLQLQI
jgi:chromosome segregation ATPase